MKYLAIIIATAAINLAIAYFATNYICDRISDAEGSAIKEIEIAHNGYKNSAETIISLLMATAEEQAKLGSILSLMVNSSPDVNTELSVDLRSIIRKMDSMETSLSTLNLLSISKQLDEIQSQTSKITRYPSRLLLNSNKTLDEKLDSIQEGIDGLRNGNHYIGIPR